MTAAMQGDIVATANRFRLGSLEVTTVLDGTICRDAVKPPFCLDLGEEDIAALGAANHIPADRFEHPFVPTLVNTGNELVLFDVGFGAISNGRPTTPGFCAGEWPRRDTRRRTSMWLSSPMSIPITFSA